MQELSMKDIFPLIEEGIRSGGKYRFYPKGESMLPLIREGIDSVVLTEVGSVNKFDMVLYQRDDNSYVLHRVVRLEGDSFSMCGDNECAVERGIKAEQIKAKVTAFYRGEEYVSVEDPRHIKYAKRRVASIPIRLLKARIKGIIKRIKK